MKNYRNDLEKACKNREPRFVFNKGADHANQFMQVLLDSAEESVKIYTKKLDRKVSSKDGFIEALERVLKDETIAVNIVMEEESDNVDIVSLIQKYHETSNNCIKVGIEAEVKECIIDSFDNNDYHYTVVDKSSYRLEKDIEEFKAEGSFYHDKDFAEGLDKYFDFCINR